MHSDPGAPEVIPGEEARSRFYEAYRRQSNKFDKELKEYNKELNVTLFFVRLATAHLGFINKFLTEIKIIPSVRTVRCGRFDLLEAGT